MTFRAISLAVLLFGIGRAVAQLPTDVMSAVAVTAEQEAAAANQARSGSRAIVNKVFGGNPATAPANAPADSAAAAAPAAAVHAEPAAPADKELAAINPPSGTVDTDGVPPTGAAAPEIAPSAAALAQRGRDPFRPFTLDLQPETNENEILTPLQRYELPQLRLAGVVLDLKPPRAMLQDNAGMGFIITPGTPIGRRHGVVKAIEPRKVVVEERVLDYYGREQVHQVVIEMPKENKPQSVGQE